MKKLTQKWLASRWLQLLPAMILTGIVALSVHVLMLGAGVPYPNGYPNSGWGFSAILFVQALSLLVTYRLAFNDPGAVPLFTQLAILLIILAGLRETMRAFFMAGIFTLAWRFSAIDAVPSLLRSVYIAGAVTLLGRAGLGMRWNVLGAGALSIALGWLVPFTTRMYQPIEDHFAYLSRDARWTFPYPWQAQVPAFISFVVEPTVASFSLALLVWDRLPSRKTQRYAIFAALQIGLHGVLATFLLYPLFSHLSVPMALLSESQFLLERLVLAVMTGFFWSRFGEPQQIET